MRNFLLVIILAGSILFIINLINPLLADKAWRSYKIIRGSEKYCSAFTVENCPDICAARPSCTDCGDPECRVRIYNDN